MAFTSYVITKKYIDPKKEPFYVEDISGSDNTVSIKKIHNSAPMLTIEKSLDGKTWTSMGSTSTTAITATVPANGKLYLRCSANNWGVATTRVYNPITCSSQFNVGGNTMSLLYGSNFTGEETTFPSGSDSNLYGLLREATTLVSAENLLLPATTLNNNCYNSLFFGCSSLTTAPELPATTMVESCYSYTFYGCSSLTTAPALPATTLAPSCYYSLFERCSSLTSAPALPATTLANNCYQNLFNSCTSLTTAPELPATTLVRECYRNLFYGCSSLNYIKVGFTVWPSTMGNGSTNGWTQLSVNTTGTFVCPSSLSKDFNASGNNTYGTSSTSGYTNAIPYGWTVQTY